MTRLIIPLLLLSFPAHAACGMNQNADIEPKEPYQIHLCANVIEVCDMERNPDSAECLSIIGPEAGDETVKYEATVDIEGNMVTENYE